MKFTYNWLKQYVDFDWSPQELAEKLTFAGINPPAAARSGPLCKSNFLSVGWTEPGLGGKSSHVNAYYVMYNTRWWEPTLPT